MAIYPCDQHGARYAGPQRTAYPAILNGSVTIRERRRLCAPCFSGLFGFCTKYLHPAEEQDGHAGCVYCGEDETSCLVYVTLYPGKEERIDFYGPSCNGCAANDIGLALFGSQARLEGL